MNVNSTEEALRRHLRSHNRSVLAAAGISLGFAAAGWALLYGLAFVIAMLVSTITLGVDAQPPASFHWVFLACAAVLTVAALVDRWLFPDERPADTRPTVEQFADVLLFLPRLTLAVWGNLSALVSLSTPEREQAAELLDRLANDEKISFQQLPAHVPDMRHRNRIIGALSVSQLIDLKKSGGLTWLHLGSLAPDAFRRRSIERGPATDGIDTMRSANPRDRGKLLTEGEDKPGGR